MELSLPTEILDDVIYQSLSFGEDLSVKPCDISFSYKILPRTVPGTYAVKLLFRITRHSTFLLKCEYRLNGGNKWVRISRKSNYF